MLDIVSVIFFCLGAIALLVGFILRVRYLSLAIGALALTASISHLLNASDWVFIALLALAGGWVIWLVWDWIVACRTLHDNLMTVVLCIFLLQPISRGLDAPVWIGSVLSITVMLLVLWHLWLQHHASPGVTQDDAVKR
jgi:hypothetical protein